MKKFILAILSLTLMLFTICMNNGRNAIAKSVTWCVDNNYNYRLSETFTESPDSVEAWIKLGEDSIGGTYLGNYYHKHSGFPGCTNFEVNASGHVVLKWNWLSTDYEFQYEFKNESLLDNTWHHVAITRNNNFIRLYIDGTLVDLLRQKTTSAYASMPLNIGVDYATWDSFKTPFDGEIKQVTIYTGEISEAKVASDMQSQNITSNDVKAKLLGNWYLGDVWTERTVKNSLDNGNDAVLKTFEKYVGVADTDDYDYCIVGLPDTQAMLYYRTPRLYSLFNNLADDAESKKYSFAVHVGDLSDRGNEENLYARAYDALSLLDGSLPYTIVQGNHDYDDNAKTRSSEYFKKYYDYDYMSKQNGFVGAYEEGIMDNYYSMFNAGGIQYLVLSLEYYPRPEVLRWASRVCEMYPNHRVIISTHAYLDNNGEYVAEPAASLRSSSGAGNMNAMFDGLVSQHSNVFMVLCGHCGTDDIIYKKQIGKYGNTIHSFQINWQFTRYQQGEIGEDIVCLFKFRESTKTLSICAYSYEYDACFNIQNQFIIDFSDINNPTVGK